MGVFVKKTGILYMNFHLYINRKTFSVMVDDDDGKNV